MRHILAFMLLSVLFVSSSFAADYYIAESAAGSGDGTSCANARAYTWNWSGVTAGDTVWICGTVNLVYGQAVVVGASGDGGTHNPVTLAFCDTANCGESYAPGTIQVPGQTNLVSISNKHDVIVDGMGVGIIQATDNGSAIAGYTNNLSPTGIYVWGTSTYITVQNLTIRTMYVHQYQTTTDDTMPFGGGKGIYFQGTTYVDVHDCDISDASTGIVLGSGFTNAEIYNNNISRCCHGISGGSGEDDQIMDEVNIHNNDIEIGGNWMSNGSSDCHANGIYLYSDGHADPESSSLTNSEWYNNYIHGPMLYWTNFPPGSKWGATSFAHFDYGTIDDAIMYNNLFIAGPYLNTSVAPNPSNGVVSWSATNTDARFWNNTVVGTFTAACFAGKAMDIRNNVCVDANKLSITLPVPTSDYNNNYDFVHYANYTGGPEYDTLAAWQTYLGGCPNDDNECNSITDNPNLDAVYKPPAGSPIVGAGQDLTSYCTSYTALCYDRPNTVGAGSASTVGNARPSGSAWDIGAYQYIAGNSAGRARLRR